MTECTEPREIQAEDWEEYHRADSSIASRFLEVTPNPRVLLVEDCEDTQELLTQLLEDVGFDVTTANDGTSSIEVALSAAENGCSYDVILVDIGLPDIDGLQVARTLRQHNYEKPIIAITAGPTLNKRWDSVHSGCDDFLAKRTIHQTILPALEHLSNKYKEPEL